MQPAESKLLEMLTAYAAAHQHPFNIVVHLIGIPTILFGLLVPASWVTIEINSMHISLAQLLVIGLFLFYLTLDIVFALSFLLIALAMTLPAAWVADLSFGTAIVTATVCVVGGYLAQFAGHAVERSMPVLIRHPLQAHLAAPFFTVVELFKLAGLREKLFNTLQERVARLDSAADA